MRNQSYFRLVAALAIIFLTANFAHAQSSSEAWAIKGGTVVTVTGATIPNGIIIIRNGLIEAVGADVAVPADARLIDATGMMVYPGLFDAYSSYGIKPPAAPTGGGNQQQAFIASLSVPPSQVGLLPETLVTDQLSVTAETFDQQRGAGITTALTAPRDGVFRGQSAILNLGTEASDKLLLRAPHSLSIGFGTARGGYPNSLMGVFAFLRQSLLDAQHYRDEWERYSKAPRGMERPQHNNSSAALIPIMNGKMPVIFNVNSVREMKRAMALAEEFKLKYLLSGALQSYQIADLLKAKNVTVLLSLGFPQKPSGLENPEEEPLHYIKERLDAPKAAAELHKAGVKFAFTSGSLMRSADFVANAGRAIEAGLPKDEALKAMTIYPAQIFGLAEQLGSIEKGKIANLIVTSGDLFSKDTKIKYTFVDGKQFINKAPEAPAIEGRRNGGRPAGSGGAMNAANAAGSWALTINSPQGVFNSPLTIQQNGEAVTGEIGSPAGVVPISNAKISGNELTFSYTINFQGQQLNIAARGKIEGNAISGSMETMGTSFDFSGTKKPQ